MLVGIKITSNLPVQWPCNQWEYKAEDKCSVYTNQMVCIAVVLEWLFLIRRHRHLSVQYNKSYVQFTYNRFLLDVLP